MHQQIEESKGKLEENITALQRSNEVIKSTQKELIASEKFASLGKLSAGIAHEIGNPLS
ncbi:MAG: two-component sensor histidine kinase, partial [Candidatus Dadabacteria bacterium]|nr:two-component sensor histidine kinase [Candidatus Dadabacteria bacterium]NIV41771.1 two-component sensor histidine kinase [Candidatus Dadabacteria bacterium]NIX14640.1 two-component sensor histidine kinase [Candidatus Dadabacteria bacterium]